METQHSLFRNGLLGLLCALAAGKAGTPARGDAWSQALHQFVIAGSPGKGSEMKGKTFASTMHVTRDGAVVRYVARRRSSGLRREQVSVNGVPSNARAFLIHRTSYVSLRTFLQTLHEVYGLHFTLSYRSGGQVAVQLDKTAPAEGANRFGAGMARLWDGDVDGAAALFAHAAAAGGEDAQDASSLAAWLDDGAPGRVGMIRLAWWNLPDDVDVYIDRHKVIRGALFIQAAAGLHTLSLTKRGGADVLESAFFDSTFIVRSDQAYVIQFGAADTK